MTEEVKRRILNVLKRAPEGLSAYKIAKKLNLRCETVNRNLSLLFFDREVEVERRKELTRTITLWKFRNANAKGRTRWKSCGCPSPVRTNLKSRCFGKDKNKK